MEHKNLEFEDAYIIQEYDIDQNYDDVKDLIVEDSLNDSLDSLDLSDEENITNNYDQLKIASENIKKRVEQKEYVSKITEFKPTSVKREEVVEDYIRNFFTKYKLERTLDEFNVNNIN